MMDVIFNGSTTRKPVSRASVELVFDNAEGKAAGQWKPYAEVAVKRVLDRSGESTYYINGLQVRRKDDAFEVRMQTRYHKDNRGRVWLLAKEQKLKRAA